MTVYQKKGNLNSKEKKYSKALQAFVDAQTKKNPEFIFTAPKNQDELEAAYNKYCVEDVHFEESPVIKTPQEEKSATEIKAEEILHSHDSPKSEKTNTMQTEETRGTKGAEEPFIDPFNSKNPIERDYVNKETFSSNGNGNYEGQNFSSSASFTEPKTEQEAFEMPKDFEDESVFGGGDKPKKDKQKEQAFNPQFDDVSAANKKRSVKRFAKYIVEVTCMLAEKGFVWFANKDINEAKLVEYEMKGEMDLSILLTLEDGQEATVKQFFAIQCLKAEQLAKIDGQEKEDLTDALVIVLLQKGIAPTPEQELILISLKIFGMQAVALFTLRAQSNSVLDQLRKMGGGNGPQRKTARQTTPHNYTPNDVDSDSGKQNDANETEGNVKGSAETEEPGNSIFALENIAIGEMAHTKE